MVANGGSQATAEFVAGKTWADSFMWERQWNVPSVFCGSSSGLTMPSGCASRWRCAPRFDPLFVCENGPGHNEHSQTIDLRVSARALDGDEAFYRRAGMREAEIAGGDELALQAGIGYGYKLRLFWETLANQPYKEHVVDWGEDFDPPQGSANERVTDFFIPAEDTGTGFSKGPLKGSVRFGMRVDVRGSVDARIGVRQRGRQLQTLARPSGSKAIGSNNPNDGPQRMTFTNGAQKTWRYRLLNRGRVRGAKSSPSYEESFGYRVDQVHYDSRWSVVPGVKVQASARYAGYGVGGTWTFWLDGARIPIGNLELRRHAGTRSSISDDRGTKIWHRNGPGDNSYCQDQNQL